MAPLGDLVEILDRFRVPVNKEERAKRPGSIPYYGATGQVGWIDDYIFDRELVLLGEDGAPFLDATKPKAYMVRGKSWVNNHAHVLVARRGILNSFLLHQLNQVDYRQFVSGTTRFKLPQAQMASIPICIAPEEEQKRIVEEIEKQLSRLDASTIALRQVHASLKRYRNSVLTAACEGRLVPTEAELARAEGRGYEHTRELLQRISQSEGIGSTEDSRSDLPDGWTLTTVQQLAEVGTGATPLRSQSSYYEGGTIPWVTSGALNEPFVREPTDFVTQKALHETNLTMYPIGTLLIAMYGEGKTRGKCSELLIEACTNQAIAAITTRGLAAQCRPFMKIFLQKNYNDIRRVSAGGVQPNLNLSLIRGIRLALPPLAEQVRIVEEAERLLSFAQKVENTLESSLVRAGGLRQSILQTAFEGKLLPQREEDEPASVLLERIRQNRAVGLQEKTRPRRGTGIKPGASAPGPDVKSNPKPRRGGGSERDSASAPSGLLDEFEPPSLGLKPQALRLGPFGARDFANNDGQDFLFLPGVEQIDLVWDALFGLGPLEKDEAIRTTAFYLRDEGKARFQRLRAGGPLYEAIASAIDRGVREGSFDRPRRGHVRALFPDARDYSRDDWHYCLLKSLNHEAVPEADALRAAAEWARENMGLEFIRLRKNGVILKGLKAALRRAIRAGEVRRNRGMVLRSSALLTPAEARP